MSRPKPTVLLRYNNKESHKIEEVLLSEAIFAVFYDGKPINLKSTHGLINIPGPTYKKVSFPNPGHALNLAKKLNQKFKTDKFKVFRLTQGEEVKNENF